MAADVKETKFIEQVLKTVTQIVSNQEELTSAVDIFNDRSYASGLEDSDFTEYGITKSQFIDVANFVESFNKFLDNDNSLVFKDQRKVLNILRVDK